MIGKGRSISHIVNIIDYIKSHDNPVEIDRNLVVGESGKEISNEFRIFQEMNARCEKNSFSFVISPAIEEGKELSVSDYRKITQEFLKELKLENNQYISYLHKANHYHLHLVVNRINELGKARKDHFIGKKAQKAAEKVALNRNLTTAKEIQLDKEGKLRSIIEKAHDNVLKSKPSDIHEYVNNMKEHGIKTHLKYASDKKVVGVKFQVGKETIKGSAVNKQMSAMNLQKTILNISKTINNQKGRSL